MSTLRQEIERWETDLFRTVHSSEFHPEIAETAATRRALSRIALRFERTAVR